MQYYNLETMQQQYLATMVLTLNSVVHKRSNYATVQLRDSGSGSIPLSLCLLCCICEMYLCICVFVFAATVQLRVHEWAKCLEAAYIGAGTGGMSTGDRGYQVKENQLNQLSTQIINIFINSINYQLK